MSIADWSIPFLFNQMLAESKADGILVSVNKSSRSMRFEFVRQGCKPIEFNIADSVFMPGFNYGAPMDHSDIDTKGALLNFARAARREWSNREFHSEYENQYTYTNPNQFFNHDDIRKWAEPPRPQHSASNGPKHIDELRAYMKRILEEAMKIPKTQPQGTTTIISAVDVSTGKECPVRELPRIEAPKEE